MQQYVFLSSTKQFGVFYNLRPSKRCWFLIPGACLFIYMVLLLICSSKKSEAESCRGDRECFCAVFFRIPKFYIDIISDDRRNVTHLPKVNETDPINAVRKKILGKNLLQHVWNLHEFGLITNDTIIIAIQAHKRKEYLQQLIHSLERSKYIEETLLVFSHSFYSDEINDIVTNIKFARVIQIFFPYSLQTHPDIFPGFSQNDCPHGISIEEVKKINCFGKARDVKSLQVKHHWWWKINVIFNHLKITRNFNGLVFFLEEDHYVFPDVLHMLKLMRGIVAEKCPDCNLFGLGHNPKPWSVWDYRGVTDQVNVVQWNNMGFAFDRQFWKGLSSKTCSDMFCEYNDYNWDFTLAYLSHKCLQQEIKPLNVVSPRVFHIGDCGLHFHSDNCTSLEALRQTKLLEASVLQYLFPREVRVGFIFKGQMKVDGRNGGWDDPRDIKLCKELARGINEFSS